MRRFAWIALLAILLSSGWPALFSSVAYAEGVSARIGQKLDPPPVTRKHEKVDSTLLDIIDASTRGFVALNAAASSQRIALRGESVRVTVNLNPAAGATGL